MELHNHIRRAVFGITFIAVMGTVQMQVFAAQQQREIRQKIENPGISTTVKGNCGAEMEFDKNSGRMIRKNRVDLVVTQVELKRVADNNVAITATIINRCPGSIEKNVSVSMEDVVVSVGPPPPNRAQTTSTVLLGNKTSYRVTVDNNNQIREINERNNSCSAHFPSTLTSKIHRCP